MTGLAAALEDAGGPGRTEAALTRIGTLVLAGLFFAMPLNGLRPVESVSYGDLLLFFAAAIAAVLVLYRRRLPALPLWLWGGAALILLSAVLVSLFPAADVEELERSFPGFFNENPSFEVAKLLAGAALLPVVVATIARGWSQVELLVSCWIAGVAFSCVLAVSDAYLGTDLQLALTYDIDATVGFFVIEPARSIGLTVHANTLSLTAVMAVPLVISRMTNSRRVLLYLPVFLLLLVAVLLSGARAGMVGIVIAVVLTLALCRPARRVLFSPNLRVAAMVAVGLAALVAVVVGLSVQPSTRAAEYLGVSELSSESSQPATVGRFGGDSSTAESDSARWGYLEDSVRYILDRPIPGYGFRWIESSHNIYLQLLLSGGLLALVGYLWLICGYLLAAYRLREILPDWTTTAAPAVLVSLAMMLITGIVGNGIVDRYLYLPMALLFAMWTIAVRESDGRQQEAAVEPARPDDPATDPPSLPDR